MCLVAIPFSETIGARDFNLGLLMIYSFGAINVLATLLAGWASNNKYSSIAAARVVAQNIAYEIPLLLVIIALVMVTHTFNLREIVELQAGGFWHWNILRFSASPLMPVAFLIYFICMLAETNRAPFDIVEAESELIAGAFTEYAGMSFGLFFIAEYVNIVVGSCIGTILFLGGWQCPFGLLPGLHWFLDQNVPLLFHGHLGALDVSPHPVLRAPEPVMEDPHPAVARAPGGDGHDAKTVLMCACGTI